MENVATLLAVATLYANTPTFTDRMSNALNKESVMRALYDAERVVLAGKNKGDITEGKAVISVKVAENKIAKVYGYLPSDLDVEEFLGMAERDIYIARKVGAIAISKVNKVGGGQ
ncbi:MAG: type I-A CRISPR-associated protein Csa5 [Candidatus Aramenus sp.]|nr:type I-A CRISPR-associated protein Csa5 [Candidatus Aramenus sp.]